METMMRLLFAVLTLVWFVSAASAEIRVNESRFEGGTLTVSGVTQPGRNITLDKKYKTKSDAVGNFQFKVGYKPSTCMVDLRSGEDVYSAVVSGCLDPGGQQAQKLKKPHG